MAENNAATDSDYFMPYDEDERTRLRQQHQFILSGMTDPVLAPIDLTQSGLKILDSGTFDGFWLEEVSKLTPSPVLVGTDISPVAFPKDESGATKSLSFHVQSVTSPWPKDWNGTMDLVHKRLVLAGVNLVIGKQAVESLVNLARPGSGWVQIVEGTFCFLTEEQRARYPAQARFQSLCGKMLPMLGWNPSVGPQVRGWLEDMGLEEVGEKVMELHTGAGNTDKRLGEIGRKNLLEVVENLGEIAKTLPEDAGVSFEDFNQVLRGMETESATVGGMMKIYVVWGRRRG